MSATQPKPLNTEDAIVTLAQELTALHQFHWHNVYGRRSIDELAKVCVEATGWVRQALEDAYGPTERVNENQYAEW